MEDEEISGAVTHPGLPRGMTIPTESGGSPGIPLEDFYPSIAATTLGGGLGSLFDSLPICFGNVRWSHLLFVLPAAPLAALIYLVQRVAGVHYRLTSEAIERFSGLSIRPEQRLALDLVEDVQIPPSSRHEFLRTGDIHILDSAGNMLAIWPGMPYPDRIRTLLLETCQTRRQIGKALGQIQSRSAASSQ